MTVNTTEYGRNYDWERTWKYAQHARDVNSMNCSTEPNFQRKHHVGLASTFNSRKNIESNNFREKKASENERQSFNPRVIKRKSRSKDRGSQTEVSKIQPTLSNSVPDNLHDEIQRIRQELQTKKNQLRKRLATPMKKCAKDPIQRRPKSAPEKPAPASRSKVAAESHRGIKLPWKHYPNSFVTEYQRCYIPFVYQPRVSPNKIEQKSSERQTVQKPQACVRPMTTEYITNYKPFMNACQRSSVYDEVRRMRQSAQLYKLRDRSSHFSRNHLAQLEAQETAGWISEGEPTRDKVKVNIVSLQPAGKPSSANRRRVTDCSGSFLHCDWADGDSCAASDETLGKPKSRHYDTQCWPAGKPSHDVASSVFEYQDISCCCGTESSTAPVKLSDEVTSCSLTSSRSNSSRVSLHESIASSLSFAQDTFDRARRQQERLRFLRERAVQTECFVATAPAWSRCC